MPRKCKKCDEKEEIKIVTTKKKRMFNFPTLWKTVEAKDLSDAYEKIKAITTYQKK